MARKTGSAAAAEASAEVFVTAFKALTRKARDKVLATLIESEDLREDIEAALLWEQRKDEPRQSFDEYVAEYEDRQK